MAINEQKQGSNDYWKGISMKKAAFLMAVILGAGPVVADLTVVQKIEPNINSDKASAISMTIRIKGSKARLDFKPETHSSVIDMQNDKIYLIDHSMKQVMVMPLAQMKAAMAMAGQAMAGKTEKKSLQKTGKTKTINGFQCNEYTGVPGGAGISRMTCWMAENVDTKEMEPFREFAMNSAKVMGMDSMVQLKGMLIASETEMTFQGENSLSRLEVQSISRDAINDAIFVIPAGYRIMELPNIPQLGAQKAPA